MLSFRPQNEKHPDFEEIYFSNYSRFMEWALQLTRYDHADAEDLVHDLYIQCARSSSKPDNVEKLDAYLFSILRNLHYARLRRAGRSPIDNSSIIDFDSIERGLAFVDRRQLPDVRSTLRAICQYVCERKNTSRSASILILRFFFGYYPSEVMQVVRTTRGALDRSLQIARQEVRLYLERPRAIRSIAPEKQTASWFTGMSDDSQTLFLELRQAILKTCVGDCFEHGLLARRYSLNDETGFATAELAHLVSCATCLDEANTILGLPLLAERSPDDTIGRNNPSGPDGSSGGPIEMPPSGSRKKSAKAANAQDKINRKMREVFEHRPQSLRIAVNGKLRTSQKVTAALSEFHLELDHAEKPAFIEILSEQNICIVYLHVLDPALHFGLTQTERVSLSDERSMEVTLSYVNDVPTVYVVYRDPVMSQSAGAEVSRAEAEAHEYAERRNTSVTSIQDRGGWSRIAALLSAVRLKLAGWRIRQPLLAGNPVVGIFSVLAGASALCLFLWLHQPPQMTADALLAHAEVWDASPLADAPPGVIYQRVRIKTSQRAFERTLYRDIRGIRHPRREQLSREDEQLRGKLASAGVSWDAPLSAVDYAEWRHRSGATRYAVTRTGAHLLTLTTIPLADGDVLNETLTVRDTDFHAVDRTVALRDSGTIEIAELNYDVLPWGAVNQDWFEPLPVRATHVPAVAPLLEVRVPHLPSELELDEAELEARIALNQLHADTGEQILVSRSANSIVVEGIVETNERKEQLVTRLLQVPQVRSSLLSVEDLSKSPQVASYHSSEPILAYSVESKPSPLEQYLREQKLPLDQLETVSQSLFDQSVKIQQAEVRLAELHARFLKTNQLPADMQKQLEDLSQNYVDAINAALDANAQTLVSIGLLSSGPSVISPEQSASGSDSDAVSEALLTEPSLSEPVYSDPSFSEHIMDQVHRYQELCQQLISSGDQSRSPAVVIAADLQHAESRIRAGATSIQTSVSTAHN